MEWEGPAYEAPPVDPKVVQDIFQEVGESGVRNYLSVMQKSDGLYPRLQIWDCCPRVIGALPVAIHDDKNPEDVDKSHFTGMDSLDALRYLLLSFKIGEDQVIPEEYIRTKEFSDFLAHNPQATTQDKIMWNRARDDKETNTELPEYATVRNAGYARQRFNRRKNVFTSTIH